MEGVKCLFGSACFVYREIRKDTKEKTTLPCEHAEMYELINIDLEAESVKVQYVNTDFHELFRHLGSVHKGK